MMTAHPLDRPVWHALRSRQAAMALGDDRALRFALDVGPFAAACDNGSESLAALATLVPQADYVLLVEAGESPVPPGTIAEKIVAGVQMVAQRLTPVAGRAAIEPLTEADAPAMLALATLTAPGPFLSRTHRLGDFLGIKHDGRLVAMAGERMKPDGFTEVSGVCTHPDARGRGYARLLSHAVATRIFDRAETPFLHAYASNGSAIALYESLGFAIRRRLTITKLVRD